MKTCPGCNYDLSYASACLCPECGADLRPEARRFIARPGSLAEWVLAVEQYSSYLFLAPWPTLGWTLLLLYYNLTASKTSGTEWAALAVFVFVSIAVGAAWFCCFAVAARSSYRYNTSAISMALLVVVAFIWPFLWII